MSWFCFLLPGIASSNFFSSSFASFLRLSPPPPLRHLLLSAFFQERRKRFLHSALQRAILLSFKRLLELLNQSMDRKSLPGKKEREVLSFLLYVFEQRDRLAHLL